MRLGTEQYCVVGIYEDGGVQIDVYHDLDEAHKAAKHCNSYPNNKGKFGVYYMEKVGKKLCLEKVG
jgi:hypothetical protein